MEPRHSHKPDGVRANESPVMESKQNNMPVCLGRMLEGWGALSTVVRDGAHGRGQGDETPWSGEDKSQGRAIRNRMGCISGREKEREGRRGGTGRGWKKGRNVDSHSPQCGSTRG